MNLDGCFRKIGGKYSPVFINPCDDEEIVTCMEDKGDGHYAPDEVQIGGCIPDSSCVSADGIPSLVFSTIADEAEFIELCCESSSSSVSSGSQSSESSLSSESLSSGSSSSSGSLSSESSSTSYEEGVSCGSCDPTSKFVEVRITGYTYPAGGLCQCATPPDTAFKITQSTYPNGIWILEQTAENPCRWQYNDTSTIKVQRDKYNIWNECASLVSTTNETGIRLTIDIWGSPLTVGLTTNFNRCTGAKSNASCDRGASNTFSNNYSSTSLTLNWSCYTGGLPGDGQIIVRFL